jgi:nucleoside-diphosphate-sugar epimerase
MRLLVLGGTRFLGRHVVDGALARGHDVTIFTRGRTPSPWAHAVTRLEGDRDPAVAPGLVALSTGAWDAVIDTSGYLPRCVRASAAALAGRVARYLFVSSMSVYADASRPGQDETAPVAELDDPASEDVPAHYGALKAACEDVVRAAFGDRAFVVRPGLIVGPHDPTDRFAYWVARFRHPELLGERGTKAVVPAPPGRPVQFIDARDLAEWMLDLVAAGIAGTFNACSPPDLWTMGSLIDALSRHAGASASAPMPVWVDEATLIARGVEPWTELPLWIPEADPESTGFMEFDCAKAIAHGLAIRPLEATLDDTAAWLVTRDNTAAWRGTLSAAKERELLEPR